MQCYRLCLHCSKCLILHKSDADAAAAATLLSLNPPFEEELKLCSRSGKTISGFAGANLSTDPQKTHRYPTATLLPVYEKYMQR